MKCTPSSFEYVTFSNVNAYFENQLLDSVLFGSPEDSWWEFKITDTSEENMYLLDQEIYLEQETFVYSTLHVDIEDQTYEHMS